MTTEKEVLNWGGDLADREDAEAAVNTALHSCAHMPSRVFAEAMLEMVGVLVKEGAISYQDVHTRLDAAMPPHLQQGAEVDETSSEGWGGDV